MDLLPHPKIGHGPKKCTRVVIHLVASCTSNTEDGSLVQCDECVTINAAYSQFQLI